MTQNRGPHLAQVCKVKATGRDLIQVLGFRVYVGFRIFSVTFSGVPIEKEWKHHILGSNLEPPIHGNSHILVSSFLVSTHGTLCRV